ncbi:single-stranded-DNA-specific exonuclease [Natronincola peptidivorans]|uniref:Single-stranded-DNA-specific exonuclease RecJ n=1 Tax=Natronincola peptidivorans TaxID=426128 RepID=A0A1H9YXU7_9FIRM|nr:single-stranded-DNA-specific exonuclease RecJ [Natronincola peptidivorans]SES73523.1 single-stranded-DNA-specific exonuclease [Natronincola peptidivorans]
MEIQKKNWIYRKNNDVDIELLAKELHITKATAGIILNRGFKEINRAKAFLDPNLNELHDPFLLKDMKKAVDRITQAQKLKESIWIYGDYDVDGVASISIMKKYFDSVKYPVEFYIPDRMEEGYGINKKAIKKISDQGGNLIITVDCGITSVEEVDYANSLGVDMIITDHHHCHDILPRALAIINPKQTKCEYPFDMICGCGVALKLIQALMPKKDFLNSISNYLDIVAIATIADIVPLVDENRIFVKNGLKYLADTSNIGLKALIRQCGLQGKKLNTSHVGFGLAPRINATGRIGSANMAVNLLTTNDLQEATKLVEILDKENHNRQQIERQILDEAIKMIESNNNYQQEKVLVLYNENWHHGVIGIVASRIVEKYYKPTIILGVEEGISKGSGRSIPSFDLFQALSQCKEMLIKFGGHQQAAGLSLYTENIELFRKYMNNIADKALTEDDLIPQLSSDGCIALEEIEDSLLEELEKLEPFGLGNMSPRFINFNLKPKAMKSVGLEGKHLKMQVKETNKEFDTIGFNLGKYNDIISGNDEISIIFTPEYNIFNGQKKIQLNVKDLKVLKSNTLSKSLIAKEYYKNFFLFHYPNISSESFLDRIAIKRVSNKKEFIVEALENQRNLLILVNTLQQANELMKLTEIREKTMEKEFRIFYNEAADDCKSNEIHIVINPNIDKIQFKIYNSIIVYDMFFRKIDYDYYLYRNNNENTTFLYSDQDEKDNIEVLKNIIPTRKILITIYKSLKKEKDLLNFNMNFFMTTLEENLLTNINEKHLQYALEIFQEGKLIDYILEEDKCEIVLLPVNKKINIEELCKYKYYNNLYNEFLDLKKKWLSSIKGGSIHEFS